MSAHSWAQTKPLQDDIGYTKLKNELGLAMPYGAGVPVSIIEANGVPGAAITPSLDPKRTYNLRTPGATVSSHADGVADMFFRGWSGDIADKVTNIDCWVYWNWQAQDMLTPSVTTYQPKVSPNHSRVANYSYAYSVPSPTDQSSINYFLNLAHRLDWVVATDDFLQCIAVGNGQIQPLAGGFNTMAVSPAAGRTPALGTFAMDSVYVANRRKPDIVAPGSPSTATPLVSGVATCLIGAAHTSPAWSKGSYVSPRTGDTIYYAETSEVIKAALMAGADRNYVDVNPVTPCTVADYRLLASNQTNNGLDARYGAGQVNIYNSYHMLAAGQQRSSEDDFISLGNIADRGFDYDPHFGGANGSNSTGSYYFTPSSNSKLIAALVWNLKVAGGTEFNFDPTSTLYNLDLNLIDLSADGALVASSASTIDNTENLWTDLIAGHNYLLRVTRGSGSSDFDWDYALAWQSTPVPEPAICGFLIALSIMVLRRRKRK